jgi:putative transposase
MEWAEKHGVTSQHIQPGKPQQNAHIERYNRTVLGEWLDQNIIENIERAQDFATKWLWTYNNDLTNIGIGGITPAMKLKWPRKFYDRTQLKMGNYHFRCHAEKTLIFYASK